MVYFVLHSCQSDRACVLPFPPGISQYSPDASSVSGISLAPHQTVRFEPIYELGNVRPHAGQLLGQITQRQGLSGTNQDAKHVQLGQGES